jgi:hypothetical protein
MFHLKISSLKARLSSLTTKTSSDSLSIALAKALHEDRLSFFAIMQYNGVDKFFDTRNKLWIKIMWKPEKNQVQILWNMNDAIGRPNFKALVALVNDPSNPTADEIQRAVDSVSEYYRRFIRGFHGF